MARTAMFDGQATRWGDLRLTWVSQAYSIAQENGRLGLPYWEARPTPLTTALVEVATAPADHLNAWTSGII